MCPRPRIVLSVGTSSLASPHGYGVCSRSTGRRRKVSVDNASSAEKEASAQDLAPLWRERDGGVYSLFPAWAGLSGAYMTNGAVFVVVEPRRKRPAGREIAD